MQIAWPPAGIGWVLAILVLLFAVLMIAGLIPTSPGWVGGLLAALAVARLV